MRPYYPIFLDLTCTMCVVVGGGTVAERKARSLLKAGTKVRLISPEVTGGISRLAEKGKIEWIQRQYRSGDLDGATLAFAATNDEEANRLIREEALHVNLPVNVVDNLELCSFVVPSVVQKGPILAAISTSGLLPSLSKRLREEITRHIGDDYPAYARRVGTFRKLLFSEVADARMRRQILKAIASADVSEIAHMNMKEMRKRFLSRGTKVPKGE
jgi:precorrin-2 dehydrogenase/sirohydrochlorin ferrochelatase